MAQKTVTAVANAQLDTAQFKFGTASGLFDGTGDYLTVPDDADWNFGSGDFTVDMWVRFNSVAATQVFVGQFAPTNLAWQIYFDNGTGLHFAYSTDGSASIDTAKAWSPSTNTWYHIAACRSGNDVKLFVDGTQVGTTIDVTGATFFNSTNVLHIGASSPVSNEFNGWMDELRVTKGLARFTGNFTAPGVTYYSASDGLRLHFDGADASTTFTDSSADTTDIAPATGRNRSFSFII